MIRYVCDVEGCEEICDVGQNSMGMGSMAPTGWHEVITRSEFDKKDLRGMNLPRQMAHRKMALMSAKRRLVCPKHPMPDWKEGSGEDDEFGDLLGVVEQ